MEREGEMRKERRRGGGGEKMRGRRGLMIGGMVLGLLMGCNNGGELEAEKRLSAIGRRAENVFYSFMELVSDVLGFDTKVGKKKEDVGQHFVALGKKLETASNNLEEVAKKAETEVDKSDSSKNLIREAIDAAKGVLGTLKGHLDDLGTISTGDSNVVGWAENSQQGVKVAESELNKAYDALKGIVDTAKAQQVKEPIASGVTLQASSIGVASPETGAKILATNAPGAAVGEKAALILASVSGEEMLESIVKSKGAKKALSGGATAETTPFEFALGGSNSDVANANAKPAAISGGIALRSLVKDGKLAAHTDGNDYKAVQSVGVNAVNKLLVAVEDIIRKTVKKVLEKAKTKIDEARKPKAVGNE